MAEYTPSETVIIDCDVTNVSDAAADPATSIVVRIKDPAGTLVITDVAMTKDDTGDYHYDYNPAADAPMGRYNYEIVAISSTRTTITADTFDLVARKT